MLWLPVDRTQKRPLIQQVYEQIRMRILHGELRAGMQLPSTRELARDLHVSRNVVLEAYDQLLAEGYIESRPGSGTYVASGAFFEVLHREPLAPPQDSVNGHTMQHDCIDFRSGIPALSHFPRKLWARLAQQVYAEAPARAFGYDAPEGRPELRNALAAYLLRTRGVRCHPDQLVITTGAAQAIVLISRLLLTHGDEVVIEDPVTYEVQVLCTASGATLCPIPVDEHGMKTDQLPASERARCVVLTPSHQFPLGGILPIQRRLQLIQFARTSDCYLVEDDYDSEFRYTGTPVHSLQELEPERVIYIGTFSKILLPAFRLGYVVLPVPLVQRFRVLKRLSDLHSPVLEQLILARFIEQGHLERHIMHMRRLYRQRRAVIIDALMTHFPQQVRIHGDATGLHLVAEFPNMDFTEHRVEALKRAGVCVYPVEVHAIHKGCHRSKIILGYGNLTDAEIEEGIKRMKMYWELCLEPIRAEECH